VGDLPARAVAGVGLPGGLPRAPLARPPHGAPGSPPSDRPVVRHGPVLYDTLRREEVPFEPREEGKASMYVCGPPCRPTRTSGTGGRGRHRRAAPLPRLDGYEVTAVQNVTDIDDKIILRARRERVDPAVIATRYTRAWNRTMDALGVLPPDVQPLATGHLLEMQALIAELIDQGKAYAVDGDVFFRVRTFEGYGKLSRPPVDDMQQGEDVVDADRKEDPLDFAMWKSAKPGEPSWPSPWGDGPARLAHRVLGDGGQAPRRRVRHPRRRARPGLPAPRERDRPARGRPRRHLRPHWVHNGMVRWARRRCPSRSATSSRSRRRSPTGASGRCACGTCRPSTARR
jgi:hypothetical protein